MQFLANRFAEDFTILPVPNLIDVVENGKTPLENAQIKVCVYKNLDAPVIAGDT
jgi:inosine/xanthosine triphosphate pyrophosphatase family protein